MAVSHTLPGGQAYSQAQRLIRLVAGAWIWSPLLVVVVLTWPSVGFQLPNYESELGENYQPLRALRFFADLGRDFHKYGPMPNFLLAPGYAASMAFWWATGRFDGPSDEFPYGLREPLEQLTWLLWHGRVLFLLLFLGLCTVALRLMRTLVPNPAALGLAFLLCVAANPIAARFVANTRPDGPMFAFLAAALGLYCVILVRGLTARTGALLSLLAVCSISTKELAGTVFVLPYLALGLRGIQSTRGDPAARRGFLRNAGLSVGTGVGMYLLLNVVYAPAAWLRRISYWLTGQGADSAVWGGVESGALSWLEFLGSALLAFLNNLGPGGTPMALVALAVLAIRRPPHAGMALLPFVSVTALGLLPLGYTADRFYTTACVALVPPVALGLAELLRAARSGPPRVALGMALAVAVAANLVWGTFAWHRLEGLRGRLIERSLATLPIEGRRVNLLSVHPRSQGKARLAALGHTLDWRSAQEIADAEPADRPDRIYATQGMLGFVERAREYEARAELLAAQGFDAGAWEGLEALGYRETARIETRTPPWFPFDWMPAVRAWAPRAVVVIYDRELPRGVAPAPGRTR